jgi:Co/Zn/Cd efflux system component
VFYAISFPPSEPLFAADGSASNATEEGHYSAPPPVDTVDSFCGIEVTNRTILWVSASTFLVFVIAEVIGALASNSLSLLGDASAMSVDVFTVRSLSVSVSIDLSC